MILEFFNKSRINVNDIFGGPVNVNGIIRDVLSIEIDTENMSIEYLERLFSHPGNLAHLYTYESDYDEDGELNDVKIEIGEGYTILIGVEEVTRKISKFPGKIAPEEFETLYIVNIAQLTYDEWIEFDEVPDMDINEYPITIGGLSMTKVSELEDITIKRLS